MWSRRAGDVDGHHAGPLRVDARASAAGAPELGREDAVRAGTRGPVEVVALEARQRERVVELLEALHGDPARGVRLTPDAAVGGVGLVGGAAPVDVGAGVAPPLAQHLPPHSSTLGAGGGDDDEERVLAADGAGEHGVQHAAVLVHVELVDDAEAGVEALGGVRVVGQAAEDAAGLAHHDLAPVHVAGGAQQRVRVHHVARRLEEDRGLGLRLGDGVALTVMHGLEEEVVQGEHRRDLILAVPARQPEERLVEAPSAGPVDGAVDRQDHLAELPVLEQERRAGPAVLAVREELRGEDAHALGAAAPAFVIRGTVFIGLRSRGARARRCRPGGTGRRCA